MIQLQVAEKKLILQATSSQSKSKIISIVLNQLPIGKFLTE